MRILAVALIIAAYTWLHYAPQFIEQFNDYKKSSACIADKMNQSGIDRNQIVVIGDSCKIKE